MKWVDIKFKFGLPVIPAHRIIFWFDIAWTFFGNRVNQIVELFEVFYFCFQVEMRLNNQNKLKLKKKWIESTSSLSISFPIFFCLLRLKLSFFQKISHHSQNSLCLIRFYYTTLFLPNARTQRKMSFSIESIVTFLFHGLDFVLLAIDRSSWALEFSSANLAYFMLVYAFWINKMKSHSSLFYSILIYWIVCSTNLIIAILVLVNYKHL